MITQIDLAHFKCFETLKLPLGPLTLLSGLNASGKSSLMQALVLLHQTMREHEWSRRLMLNGNALRLGRVRDVTDQVSGGRVFSLAIRDEDAGLVEWEFGSENGAEMSMAVLRVRAHEVRGASWQKSDSQPLRPLQHLCPEAFSGSDPGAALVKRLRDLTWLSAERLGPRDLYALEHADSTPLVGPAGENAASVLYSRADEPVAAPLRSERAAPQLLRQVEARMGDFFPGFEMDLLPVERVNAVTLGVRTSRATDFHRPGHTGFGITQALPIVVTVLSAKPDDLVLIENPEVHLHPAGQARMGEFLAEAANAGVQVLVESHSDHVLNGIRRAVRANNLRPADAAVHFFRPRHEAEASGVAQVESPSMNADGNIDSWPRGFFDQFDQDMNYLAGWG